MGQPVFHVGTWYTCGLERGLNSLGRFEEKNYFLVLKRKWSEALCVQAISHGLQSERFVISVL